MFEVVFGDCLYELICRWWSFCLLEVRDSSLVLLNDEEVEIKLDVCSNSIDGDMRGMFEYFEVSFFKFWEFFCYFLIFFLSVFIVNGKGMI